MIIEAPIFWAIRAGRHKITNDLNFYREYTVVALEIKNSKVPRIPAQLFTLTAHPMGGVH